MSSPQILVVEDEKIVAKDIQNRLKNLGYSVPAIASSGEEALKKAQEYKPDLVLMDIVLQGNVDGIETADRVRELLGIPVIYLTAYSDESTLQRAKITESFGYLVKPFHERELRATIEMALFKHRMESRLRENERWLAAILKSVHDGVLATDTTGAIRFINPVAETLTGWKYHECLGKNVAEVLNLINEETRQTANTAVTRAIHDGVAGQLGQHLVLLSREGLEFPVEGTAAPIHDDKGHFAGLVVAFRDIAGRIRAEEELRRSESRLRQSQKLASVGRLASGVAHDFNNLLTVIMGYTELLMNGLAAENSSRLFCEVILKAGERASFLTRQLLALSRNQVLRPCIIDPNRLLEGMEKMIRRVVGQNIELVLNLDSEIAYVKVDPAQMEQVILNLVVNSRDAITKGGKITLETKNVTLGDDYVKTYPEVHPGPYVLMAVSDTGRGMDEYTKANLFEPFFSTKEQGGGAGLGLATVYGIVKQSKGHIEVISELGAGTTLKILLPRVDEKELATKAPGLSDMPHGTETVLILEADETVRSLLRKALETLGYTVLEARSPSEALKIGSDYKDPIHLMICDLMMEQMEGKQLALRLAPHRPSLKSLYMTGSTDETFLRHGILESHLALLSKPFTPYMLAWKVREVLDAPQWT